MLVCRVSIKQNCLVFVAAVSLIVYALLSSQCLVGRIHRVESPVKIYELGDGIVSAPGGINSNKSVESSVRLIPLINFVALKEHDDEPYKYRQLGKNNLKPVRRLPDALVIGVKKSGTRALLEFLRLHPDVRAAGSEVHFFDRHYMKGFNWYRRRMPPTLDGQITMEKTPSYFVTKEAPIRVRKMDPKTKLLVVVRDPVTRAVSDYAQAASKKKNRNNLQGFEKLAFVKDTKMSVVDTTWGPVRIGVYAKHLSRWMKHFPMKQMLFVSGERLVADPALEMSRVQDFLGLKRVITEKHFYFNATKGFPCLMKSEGRPTPHCLGKTKGRSHPYIDPVALERLREFYRPFNAKFYEMTDSNLFLLEPRIIRTVLFMPDNDRRLFWRRSQSHDFIPAEEREVASSKDFRCERQIIKHEKTYGSKPEGKLIALAFFSWALNENLTTSVANYVFLIREDEFRVLGADTLK